MNTTTRRTARSLCLGLLATGAAALLFSSTAEAQPYYSSGHRGATNMNAFHQADLNGDGYLSRYEMRHLPGYVRAKLSTADENSDGYISSAEARSMLVGSYATPARRYRMTRRYRRTLRRVPAYRYRRARVIRRRVIRNNNRRRVIRNNRAIRSNRSNRKARSSRRGRF